MTGSRRRGWAVLALAVLALAGAVAVRPPHAPPLYDGLGFPDEPYRWVAAPAGSGPTKAATNASVTIAVDAAGSSAAARAFSAESGPQVALAVTAGAFAAPAGTRTFTLTATAAAAPPPPSGGVVVSNLYRIAATAAGGAAVPLAPAGTLVLNLRTDAATDQQVVVERWTGTAWQQVGTSQVGTDIYAAQLDRLGAVAVVKLDRGATPTVTPPVGPSAGAAGSGAPDGSTAPLASGSTGPGAGIWIGLGSLALLVLAGLLWLRLRAARHPGER